MFVDKKGRVFPYGPKRNKTFNENAFQCDTLMAPIISELIKKGYMTKACCQGHVHTDDIVNYDECLDDPSVLYASEDNFSVAPPYVMFADDVKVPLEDLPLCWEWEYSVPRSEDIHDEYDAMRSRNFTFRIGDIVPLFDMKRGFNLSIRPNYDFFRMYNPEDWAHIKEDPFIFYDAAVKAHRMLYNWAKSLPNKEE